MPTVLPYIKVQEGYLIEGQILELEIDFSGDVLSNLHTAKEWTVFSEKDIRYNIFCLGPLAAKLPQPLYSLMIFMIKIFSGEQHETFNQLINNFNYFISCSSIINSPCAVSQTWL